MNLQQLEYIVALDRYKSFSKAADACCITQATLSTMVKKLELELDVIIFDRKTNPVITTDSGREIIEEAKKILFHVSDLQQISAEVNGKIEGELKLGIIPTVASNLLHRVIPHFLDKYTQLKLNIQEVPTHTIIQQLKMGEIDAGIVSTPLKTEELEETFLYYEKLMVYGKSKKTEKQYFRPKDMTHENVWLLEQGNCLSNQISNICSLNPKKINSNLHFHPNSFDSLLNMVDRFKGLTIIPELYFADLPHERKMNVTDFSLPYPVREISLIYYRPYAKLRLLKVLSQEIKEIVSPTLQTNGLKNSEMIIAKI